MRIRRSADTPDHLRDVAQDREFLASFEGWRLVELAKFEGARALEDADIWPVSGATLTSTGVIDGVLALAHKQTNQEPPTRDIRWAFEDALILIWLIGGIALGFTKLRSKAKLRTAFRTLILLWQLAGGGGLIALTLILGWSANGAPWRTTPGIALLVLLALGLPWVFGRNLYCQELCPHGIAQDFLRRIPKLKNRAIGGSVRRGLRWLAPGLIAIGLIVVLLDLPLSLSAVEPFDVYPLWRSGGWVWGGALIVFGVGLVISLRYPMAYCRYGCPTGWLLRSVTSSKRSRHLNLQDAALVCCALVAISVVSFSERAWHFAHPVDRVPSLLTPPAPESTPMETQPAIRPNHNTPASPRDAVVVIDGTTMQTTWRVWVIDPQGDAQSLGLEIAAKLSSLEAELSVWREGSVIDQINHTLPGQWVRLSPRAVAVLEAAQRIGLESRGAFDIAIGGQVATTGLGAPGLSPQRHPRHPTPRWELDPEGARARRLTADCQLDLGGILQGTAADTIATHLLAFGAAGCLVEVGGEIRARGQSPDGGWPILINGLDHQTRVVHLSHGAIATSGTHRTTLGDGNHLIDTATGLAQSATCQAVVWHDDAATADAWATALAAAGPTRAKELAASQGLAAQITWTDAQGTLHQRGVASEE